MSNSITLTTNRYCAVADNVCKESNIEFQGERSCFLGYPFTPAYMESMEHLRQSLLNEQNIHATLPTDVWEGGVIFCKLCREIFANNFVLSEITDLNRNVLFEHGYAIAVRRHGLLLRDRTKNRQEFPLLKDVEQVYYDNRADILRHVAIFEIDDREPVERPLRLIGMCQTCDIEERYNLIYFLRNESRSDAVKAINKLLRKEHLFFDVIDDNPNDIAGHEVHQYCQRIQQARYVVAHFVSDERRDHQVLNARVAFLMGLAMGFGKRILILQETHIGKKMIDLKGVIREYDRESQVRVIVQEWLNKQKEYVVSYKEMLEKARPKKKPKAITLRDLDFGPVAAEKDFDLPRYFVETPYYKRAQRGDRTLFLGRRGSGKTAMFSVLSEALRTPNNVVVKIAPRDYELLRLEGFLAEEFSTAHWRFVYGSIWRNVLLTEIVQAIIEHQQQYPDLPISEALGQLMDVRDQNRELFDLPFTDRLTHTIEQLQDLPSYGQNGKNQKQVEQVEQALKSIRFREAENILKEFVQERRIYVLIDNLDKNWTTENEQTCLLLAALIHEADRLNTYLTPGLRIIVFLRSDIFDVVKLKDSEIDKRSKDVIQWNKALLAEVIARRIANAKGFELADRTVEEAWSDIFCRQVSEEDTISHVINRTLLRPRDVLQFCSRCLEEAQNQRHDYVREEDVLCAEESYSADILLDLWREYHIGYPDLIEVLWLFKELPQEIEELKIADIIEKAQSKPESLKQASEWINDYSTEQLIEFFYDIGFIGVKSRGGDFAYSCDTSLKNATLDGLQMIPYQAVQQVPFTLTISGVWDWLKQQLGFRKQVVKKQRVFNVHPAFRKHLRIG